MCIRLRREHRPAEADAYRHRTIRLGRQIIYGVTQQLKFTLNRSACAEDDIPSAAFFQKGAVQLLAELQQLFLQLKLQILQLIRRVQPVGHPVEMFNLEDLHTDLRILEVGGSHFLCEEPE
ncbi:hypothetical protein D3C73_1277810 [compost metagenome]